MRAKNRIQQKIIDLVQERWTRHEPLLLAPLGGWLRNEFESDLHAELAGRKLKTYLETELADEVKIIRNPNSPIAWALIPAIADESQADFDSKRTPGPRQASQPSAPQTMVRYRSELWDAFSNPVPENTVRYIKLVDGSVQVEEHGKDESPPEGFIAINPDEAVEASTPFGRSYSNVSAKIERWGSKHSLDLTPYKTVKATRSVLDLFLDAIAPAELHHLSLPMHIVKALNDKKV